jgi:cytoskeletal protein CcmA (bactofilin family)
MKTLLGLLCCLVALSAGTTVRAEDEGTVERDFGSDRFAAGGTLLIKLAVDGDLIAAGGRLDVNTTVGGDALLAGGNVITNKKISQNLYAAGGRLQINDAIGRNARVAGGQIEFSPNSDIAGNLSAVGGQITLNGKVKGLVQAAGGRVKIDSSIGGDVRVTAGQLELGPNARIAGKLLYASREPLKRDPAAQVQGEMKTFEPAGGWPVPENVEHNMGRRGGWTWTIGLLIVALAFTLLLPDFHVSLADQQRSDVAKRFLVGFITLVCVPAAALLFLITIIGVPLGLLTMLLYFLLLVLGYVSTGITVGQWGRQRIKPDSINSTVWNVGSAVIGVLLVSLLARIPWLGGWVALAALLFGLGALVTRTYELWSSPRRTAQRTSP